MKNRSKRKIISVLIILGGLAVAYTITTKNSNTNKSQPLLSLATNSKINNPSLDFKSVRSSEEGKNFLRNQETNNKAGNNLTDNLAQAYAEEIFRKNPDGLRTANGQQTIKTPTQDTTETLLQKTLSRGLKFNQLEMKDIGISTDNSKKNQIIYLKEISNITKKNFGAFDKTMSEILDELMINQNNQSLYQYLNIVPTQINDLLSLQVPSLWKEFHLQNLNLWQKKLIVFTALAELTQDPLKSYLALQKIPEVIEENLNLQTVLEERFRELST